MSQFIGQKFLNALYNGSFFIEARSSTWRRGGVSEARCYVEGVVGRTVHVVHPHTLVVKTGCSTIW
jgi:hypothetical protein